MIFLLFSTSAFAISNNQCNSNILSGKCPWKAVVSVGGGVALSADIGKSKTFPIINPDTDEFYAYSAYSPNQTVGVFDSFWGRVGAPPKLGIADRPRL
ncbi:MAG: hypothetical protein ABI091_28170 [Ferruginibacter sp.]